MSKEKSQPASAEPIKDDTRIDLEKDDSVISQTELRKQFRSEILTKYIYPNDEETIKTLLEDKKFYSKLLQAVRISKIIFSGFLVPGLILSDSQFSGKGLNYVAGIFSLCVAVLDTADRVIVQSSKKRSDKINDILDSLGAKYRLPDSTIDDPLYGQNIASLSNLKK